ncbi:hypothetical protein CFN78_21720 [Amycolatopsis antarctica]|uniref:Uncharacterized protein n=1 Tax=Amycolatopsis antarctica TaxID=1854586 RepID=A0A263CYB5_9PSEU|nr:hypothetical protein [Amycolatopsis antarctica]OZM71091.1 hypothetical protein CFN78_21720 [Amycolatopsis antarctica]
MKRTLLTAVVAPTVIGAGIIATTGVSQAESTYNFRLSNFSATVAEICVETDADKACTGAWNTGKSEVFEVKANSANDWKCTAHIHGAANDPDISSANFDRADVKECKVNGTAFHTVINLEEP